MGEWIKAGRDDLRFQRRLEDAAQHWHKSGRPAGSLWRPPDLDLLRNFHRRAEGGISQLQDEFFRASDDADRSEAKRNAQQRRNLSLYLKVAVGTAGVSLVLACLAFGMFLYARNERNAAEMAIAEGFVHSLGHNSREVPLNATELNTLWELSLANSRIQSYFIDFGLQSENNSNHLRRRLEVAIQADVGLRDLDRKAIRTSIVQKLQASSDDVVDRTCIEVGLALRETDPTFSSLALRVMTPNRDQWDGNDIIFVSHNVDPKQAAQIAAAELESLTLEQARSLRYYRYDSDQRLYSEYSVLLSKLDQDESAKLAESFVDKLLLSTADLRPSESLHAIALTVEGAAGFLSSPNVKERYAHILAKRLDVAMSQLDPDSGMGGLVDSLNSLDRLKAMDVSEKAKYFIKRLQKEIGVKDSDELRQAWQLDEQSRIYVSLKKFMKSGEDEEIALSIALECLSIIDDTDLTKFRDENSEFPRVVEALIKVGPHCNSRQLASELSKRLDNSDAKRLCVIIQLLIDAVAIDRNDPAFVWKEAAASLFKNNFGDENLGTLHYRLEHEAGLYFNENGFTKFLKALDEISKYGPKNMRQYVEQLTSPTSVPFTDLVVENWGQKHAFHSLSSLHSFRKDFVGASKADQVKLARILVSEVAQIDDQGKPEMEYLGRIAMDDHKLPELGEMQQRKQLGMQFHEFDIWWLAYGFAEVGGTLDSNESGQAARTILDKAERIELPSDVAGLAKMLITLAPNLSPEDSLQLTHRIASRFETIRDFNNQVSMLHVFRALLTKLSQEDVVELLKWPNCIRHQREIVLNELAKRFKVGKFTTLWEFVDWARENDSKLYASLSSPPSRPLSTEILSGARFVPVAIPAFSSIPSKNGVAPVRIEPPASVPPAPAAPPPAK